MPFVLKICVLVNSLHLTACLCTDNLSYKRFYVSSDKKLSLTYNNCSLKLL